jgi:anti-sigma-K factor RskA
VSAPDHARYADDVGAYLLGALSEIEARAFERHLEECAACREELERLRRAADALPRSVEQVEPPPGLKRSLMEVVEREAAERGTAPAREPLAARLRRALVPRAPRLALAGLVAVALVAGFGTAQLVSDDDTRTLTASVDERRAPGAGATLTIDGDGDDGGILRVQGLDDLPPGRVYQAWVQRDGMVVPQPTFEVSGDGSGAVAVPDDLDDADAVMVTRERRGGARAPSEDPIVSVAL